MLFSGYTNPEMRWECIVLYILIAGPAGQAGPGCVRQNLNGKHAIILFPTSKGLFMHIVRPLELAEQKLNSKTIHLIYSSIATEDINSTFANPNIRYTVSLCREQREVPSRPTPTIGCQ